MQLLAFNPIKEGFVGILLTFDTLIYSLISSAFRIFMALAGARLLSSDAYTDVANKIYAVIGVIMLFVLAYAMLRGIIDPDQSMKGDMGPKMFKRIIIAVVGLAIVPVLFNIFYQGQNLFLEHDVLARLFFRGNSDMIVSSSTSSVSVGDNSVNVGGDISVDDKIKEIGGAVTATSLWQAFFYPAEDSGLSADEIEADPSSYFVKGGAYFLACAGFAVGAAAASVWIPVIGWAVSALALGAAAISCANGISNTTAGIEGSKLTDGQKVTLSEAYAMAAGQGTFGIFTVFLENYADKGEITYLFGLSTIAGIFTLYAFVSFSIDMGVRAAKLAYYQIIAPIPLIMQVLPNFKSNFDQYVKSVISTFMEVFIRISVVYIVVYIICHLTEMFSSVDALWGNQDLSGIETMLALALLILGLVTFARSAPKFISDSLGIKSGDMKLGIAKKFGEGGGFAAKAIASSGLRTAAQNWNKMKGKEDPDAKGWDKVHNYAKRMGSALAGAGSGMARSTYDQFGPGEKHKMATDNEQAVRVAGNATNAAYDAGVERDERKEKNAAALKALQAAENDQAKKQRAYDNALLTGVGVAEAEKNLNDAKEATRRARKAYYDTTAVGDTTNDVQKRVTAWATGSIDTSKMDKQVKLFQDLAGLKGTLEGTVDKDDLVKSAQERVNDLARAEVADYAYAAAVKNRAAATLAARGLSTSDATYESELNAEMNRLRTDPTAGLSRANYSVDPTSAEYREGLDMLTAARREADDALKAAKKDAVARKLVEATAGLDNDTSRAIKAFFETHQADFDAYRDVAFANGQTLGEYLTSNFGGRAIAGRVDFGVLNQGLGDVTLDVEVKPRINDRGVVEAPAGNISVTVDTSGNETKYSFTDTNGTRHNNVSEEFFQKFFSGRSGKIKKSTTSDSKQESKASAMKDSAEFAEQEFRDSESYRTAKNQQRIANENKSGK